MGETKQLLQVGAESLVRRAARAAASACAEVVVVVGADARRVCAELAGLPVRIVTNPQWREGISSSIRCGVLALSGDVDAAVFVPCDQPAVSDRLLGDLVHTFDETRSETVACRYAGVVGAPALFGRSWFPRLLALDGDVGARRLLREAQADLVTVEFPDGAFDLDTPEDLARWERRSPR